MIVFFVISFITNILNSIIVDVKDRFDLSLTLTGLLPFTFFIAYGIMSIPAGFLSEKYSIVSLDIVMMSFLKVYNYGQRTALPFALRAASTARPAEVFILALKPCVLLRLILLG